MTNPNVADWPTLEELAAEPPPPIQGRLARFCVECEAVFSAPLNACPHCTCTVWQPLLSMVGQHDKEEEPE